jgi:predicted phosphoribosyltransferase
MVNMFKDRYDAGRQVAQHLTRYRDRKDALVLALPRGGVPVGYEVATSLNIPLDILVVRKLGVPGQEELAMGAIASGGFRILNEDIVSYLHLPPDAIEEATARAKEELERRERSYRDGRLVPEVRARTVILVDDGLATGASMRVAVAAVRQQNPNRIVVAVPIGSASTCHDLKRLADEVICAETPEPFYAVGQGYERFDQTADDEVRELLARSRCRRRR